MKPKTVNIIYWVATIFFALMMLADGYGGLSRQQAGVEVMNHLGYPVYIMSILGMAKVLGVIAILQTKFQAIKEWAYAGFAFNFIGAFASRAFVGDGAGELVAPIIALGIMFVPYFFWKRKEQLKVA